MPIYNGTDDPDLFNGDDDDDTAFGGGGNDSLFGNGGDDQLKGEDGGDDLDGGIGNDTVDGGASDDTLFGGQGDDLILGGPGANLLDGGAGNDTLRSGPGADSLVGGSGLDDLGGGGGDDTLAGGEGDDRMFGGDGDDLLLSGFGADTIDGGSGLDTLSFSAVSFANGDHGMRIDLAAGTATSGDVLFRFSGVEAVIGSAGEDRIVGSPAAEVLSGGLRTDKFLAGPGDTVLGGGGKDLLDLSAVYTPFVADLDAGTLTIQGVQSDLSSIEKFVGGADGNVILGGRRSEFFTGTEHADRIEGGGGNDRFKPGLGADTLDGGVGEDTLELTVIDGVEVDFEAGVLHRPDGPDLAVSGFETVFAGRGNDTLVLDGQSVVVTDFYSRRHSGAATGDDKVSAVALAHKALLEGGGGFDTLDLSRMWTGANLTASNFEAIVGSHFDDVVEVDAKAPRGKPLAQITLDAGAGDDKIISGQGMHNRSDDLVLGGAGDDTIKSGLGIDTLTGGAGRDVFSFDYFGYNSGEVRITDFNIEEDRIYLDSRSLSVEFIGMQEFSGDHAQARFYHENGQTVVEFGSGATVYNHIHLDALLELTPENFIS